MSKDPRATYERVKRRLDAIETFSTIFAGLFVIAATVLFLQLLVLRERAPEWIAPAGELAAAAAIARFAYGDALHGRTRRQLDELREILDKKGL